MCGGGGGVVIGSRANVNQSHAFQRGDVRQLHPRLENLVNHVTPAARRGTGQEMGQRQCASRELPTWAQKKIKKIVATVTGPLDPVRLPHENQGA